MPVDREAACEWYRRSAEGGDFRGQFNLGTLLVERGQDAEAAVWFDRAARTGTPEFLASMAQWLRGQRNPAIQVIATRIGRQ
jgi:TPR repeat protein